MQWCGWLVNWLVGWLAGGVIDHGLQIVWRFVLRGVRWNRRSSWWIEGNAFEQRYEASPHPSSSPWWGTCCRKAGFHPHSISEFNQFSSEEEPLPLLLLVVSRMTQKWRDVPFLGEVWNRFIWSSSSIISLVYHSKQNARIFRKYAACLIDDLGDHHL